MYDSSRALNTSTTLVKQNNGLIRPTPVLDQGIWKRNTIIFRFAMRWF